MKATIKKAIQPKEKLNRHHQIQEMFSISDYDYNLNQCDYGLKFLDQYFDDDSKQILPIASHKIYWSWWISEWDRWEHELLDFIQEHKPVVFPKFYHDEMDALVGDLLTSEGFKNYLKLFQNVRI